MTTLSEHLEALIASRAGAVPRWDQDKRVAIGLADELGVRTPRILAGPFTLDDWPEWGPDRSCVLKPVDASNCRGVVPLIRIQRGRFDSWWSMWDGEERTWDGWRGWSIVEQDRHRARGIEPYRGPWVCEELIRGEHEGLIDWKVYTVHGRAVFVRQIVRHGRRHRDCEVCCWTPGFRRLPVDVVRQTARPVDVTLPPPRYPLEITALAELIASAAGASFDTPFLRVDVLEDAEGPLLGEITAHPAGGQAYVEPWDTAVGELWSNGWGPGADTLVEALTEGRTDMDKLAVPDCHHCGGEHKALAVKACDTPFPMLRLRVHGFATCPKTKLPIPVYDHSQGRDREVQAGFLGHV